jgi:hypothetical protein
MIFELKSIQSKRLLVFSVLSFLGALFLAVPLSKNREELEGILIFLALLIAFVSLGYKLSQTTKRIDFSQNDRLSIDCNTFNYSDIEGYHKPEDAAISSAFSFKTSDKRVHHIVSLNKEKETLEKIEALFIDKLKECNPNASELNYNELHEKQLNFLKPIIYALLGIVVLFDLIFVLMIHPKIGKIPYQIILVNVLALGVIPLLIRKRKDA